MHENSTRPAEKSDTACSDPENEYLRKWLYLHRRPMHRVPPHSEAYWRQPLLEDLFRVVFAHFGGDDIRCFVGRIGSLPHETALFHKRCFDDHWVVWKVKQLFDSVNFYVFPPSWIHLAVEFHVVNFCWKLYCIYFSTFSACARAPAAAPWWRSTSWLLPPFRC